MEMTTPHAAANLKVERALAFVDGLGRNGKGLRGVMDWASEQVCHDPGLLDTLCQGTIDYHDYHDVPVRNKFFLLLVVGCQRADQMGNLLRSMVGTDTDALNDIVLSPILLSDDGRKAYLDHLGWIQSQPGGDREKAKKALETRTQQLTLEYLRSDLGPGAAEAVHSLVAAHGKDGQTWALNHLLEIMCNSMSGCLLNRPEQQLRAGQLAQWLIEQGADIHEPSQALGQIRVMGIEPIAHPNLLHQVVWLRHSNGLLQSGVREVLVDTLVGAGAGWRQAWDHPSTNEDMRQVMRANETVRRELLSDAVAKHTTTRPTPRLGRI